MYKTLWVKEIVTFFKKSALFAVLEKISYDFSYFSYGFSYFSNVFLVCTILRQKYERKRKTPSMTFSQCQRWCFSSLPLKTCGEQPHFVSSLSTGFICNSHFLFLYEHTLCRINREGRKLVEKILWFDCQCYIFFLQYA